MRIVFLGTADLACPCLEAVARMGGQQVVGVVTQPDRPKGRSLNLAPPPVKVTALRLGLGVEQPERIREPAAVEWLRSVRPDLLIIVAYGQLLPQSVLAIPPAGCINVHASLLPRWRGAAPIQHAILAGDSATGVTTMYLDERLDTGDIILQKTEPIRPDDTSARLYPRLAALGAGLLVETVGLIADGRASRVKQQDSAATYARKLSKEDGRVDWRQPAVAIERQIRAFDPWPGVSVVWGTTPVKLWAAEVVAGAGGQPGVLLAGPVIGTGEGALRLIEVQPAGSRRMSFADFQRGHPLPVGTILH